MTLRIRRSQVRAASEVSDDAVLAALRALPDPFPISVFDLTPHVLHSLGLTVRGGADRTLVSKACRRLEARGLAEVVGQGDPHPSNGQRPQLWAATRARP